MAKQGFTFKFEGDEKIKKALKMLGRKMKDMTPVYREIALILETSTVRNFMAGGRPKKWDKLKDSTIRRRRFRKDKPRNFKVQVLQDTRDLLKSAGSNYDKNSASLGIADIGTVLAYARTHQLGDSKRNIPARPFVVLQDMDVVNIEKVIDRYIARAT